MSDGTVTTATEGIPTFMNILAACGVGAVAVMASACLSTGAVSAADVPIHPVPHSATQPLASSTAALPAGHAKQAGSTAQTNIRMRVPSDAVLSREQFPVRGRLQAPSGRPVRLQVRTRQGWRTLQTADTTHGGRFRFGGVSLARSTSVRVQAPRWSVSSRTKTTGRVQYPRLVSDAVAVTVLAKQESSVAVMPGVVQPGGEPSAPLDATQLVARFSPAREGRLVVLQRRTSTGWVTVGHGRQDAAGSASFAVSSETNRYRVVAQSSKTRDGRPSIREEASPAVMSRQYPLLFEDTFSSDTLDPAKWVDQLKDSQFAASNRACSRIDPSTRRVFGGVLHMGIAANPNLSGQSCTWADGKGATGQHPYMWNTQVMTRGLFEFQYGFAAARMKVQQAKGMHSAFWLQPHEVPDGPPALGTEIDVMEFFGDSGRRSGDGLGAFVHWYEGGEHHVSGDVFPEADLFKPTSEDWWDAYHVFSVEWTPDAYIFRVDGREFHREEDAVSQAPEYLLLSMLTGDYEYKNLTPEEWTQTAQVDWVRVWGR